MRTGTCLPLTPDAEAGVFSRLRVAIAWHTLRGLLAESRLRVSLVAVLSVVFWAALYGLFHEGFAFLDSIHAEVISLLFNAFFSSLMVMLVFSTGILLYGSLYCGPEAKLLLTMPVRPEAIVAHKFREALWFASWGFVLLGSPMLVAYGVVRGAPWTFYLLLLPFLLSFVLIPATLGAIGCIVLVAWAARLRMHALSAAVVVVAAAAIWAGWSIVVRPPVDGVTGVWLEEMLGRLAVTEQKVLPSWWLASGLIEAARTDAEPAVRLATLWEAVKFLALLVANGMLLQLVCGWTARVWYRVGYSQLAGEMPARRQRRIAWIDEVLANAGTAAGRPLRLLLVKDLRLFRRDVAQWSQFLIFFGLLGLYFLNLRSFNYNTAYAAMISFLNLAVAGLILSTFTTRFVFPMISLEGRRFWILGLLPVARDQIVWSKFLFSFLGGLLPCCGLVYLSDSMLGVSGNLIAIHEVCCVMLCMGLSGIAVGLGARMPDLRESSPAKISAGFGGTLCLVLSSLYIMVLVIVAAVPTHLYLATNSLIPGARHGLLAWACSPAGFAASLVLVVALGLVTTFVPLLAGIRSFRDLEP